ncbi:MAG: response regulator [Marivirga sp.]|nr:response regulator [Marivirga sp.]
MNRVINILLVEDDSLDAMDLQRTLDRMGVLYKMKVAKNGEEGIKFLAGVDHPLFTGKPDILLLDLNMPRMNGVEFLQAIRTNEDWKDIKVFVLTTSDESEDKKATRSLGISGYITKPIKLSNPGSIDAFNLMIDLMNMQN